MKIQNITRYAELSEDTDLCTSPDALLHFPELATIIDKANSVIQRISDRIGSPQSELFPKGVVLTLQGDPVGIGGSTSTAGDEIALYEFPDWVGDSFDEWTFAHELGHSISYTRSADSAISDLRSLPILREGFAELIADITPAVKRLPPNDLASEFLDVVVRDLRSRYSYQTDLGYYTSTDFYLGLVSLCQRLSSKAPLQGHTKEFCGAWTELVSNDPRFEASKSHAKEPFSAAACFRLWHSDGSQERCDPHAVALPWISSLAQMGDDDVLDLVKLLILPHTELAKTKFTCGYDSPAGRKNAVAVEMPTWENLFALFESRWTADAKAKWEALAQASALSLSQDFGLEYQKQFDAPWKAYGIISERYRNDPPDAFYNDENPCARYSINDRHAPAECRIVCE